MYTVHQVSGWEGRELMSDFDVFIAKNGETYRYLINNANFESFIKVIKVDAETGNTIPYAGAGFQIFRPDGSKVEMTFTYPEVTTIDTFYTNDAGMLITPEKLEFGKGYSLKEVSAPYGYVLSHEAVKFDVTEENSTEESGVTIVAVKLGNYAQKGIIKISKTGEVFASVTAADGVYQPVYTVQGLAGATYEIKATEDIYTPDGKQAFADWIWSEPERREQLTKLYNEKFNSIRPREYDGSHLNFVGINPEITLRPHQVNAIAHILYGGNTLLAHVVGAGKTFEMVAAAQESKRLGLCQKSLFVVPNHLTEQWASEYLQLYPSANILVATKKDFETKNRKKFCGRIATGDYDAVIIGHSQFEKIPMSLERQRAILQQQLDEVLDGISELKKNRGDNFSIKQLERTKKTVRQKLDKLNDQSRKDDVVTFEELGVDRIFIDEAHYYKNLAAGSPPRVRGIGG